MTSKLLMALRGYTSAILVLVFKVPIVSSKTETKTKTL